jgi:hypothetical protein
MDKQAVNISDPVTKALDVFLKSVGGSLNDRYGTIDEVGEAVNGAWTEFIQGIQSNYERVHKKIMSAPSTYGIEIVGNESAGDFVNENTMGAVDENQDPFNDGGDTPPPDKEINDVFNDEDTGAVTPQ